MTGLNTPALQAMAKHLTTPFAKGASILTLALTQDSDATRALVNGYEFTEYHALFNALPRPRYILRVQQDMNVSTQVMA